MIFYEKDEAEKILVSGFTSFMSYSDLSLLAKYFKYLGKNKSQIRKSLIDFCYKYNPEFNEVLSRNSIDNAIKSSQKYFLRLKMDVGVTEKEISLIKGCGDYKMQKIIFVMLVISKYLKYNNTRIHAKSPTPYDKNFYVPMKFTEILKIAKVNINRSDRIRMLSGLKSSGLISFTYVGSFQIMFVDEDSEPFIVVNNMNDIISFYPFYCEVCGKIVKNKAKRHNLCEECYKEKRNLISRDIMRNKRNVSR